MFTGDTDVVSAALISALLEKSCRRSTGRLQAVSVYRQNFRGGKEKHCVWFHFLKCTV